MRINTEKIGNGKMILIISENNDLTTDKVIEWLIFRGVNNIIRINEDDKIKIKTINLHTEDVILLLKDKEIRLSDIDFYWFRRGNLSHFVEKQFDLGDTAINWQVANFLNFEWKICKAYIFYLLQQKKSLGNFYRSETNKLINLKIAKECGMEIPKTMISESPAVLDNFQKDFLAITKPISEKMPIYYNMGYYQMLTSNIGNDIFTKESEYIYPTLLQEKIEKQFEIRVFVMYKKIYAMAIFSQRNTKTDTDYRNYDREKMNRMVPYLLPEDLQQKILIFMEKTGLNTGSLDLIKTPDGRFVFLEVNPAGNIEMVSDTCNYNIEKEIAKTIINRVQNG